MVFGVYLIDEHRLRLVVWYCAFLFHSMLFYFWWWYLRLTQIFWPYKFLVSNLVNDFWLISGGVHTNSKPSLVSTWYNSISVSPIQISLVYFYDDQLSHCWTVTLKSISRCNCRKNAVLFYQFFVLVYFWCFVMYCFR